WHGDWCATPCCHKKLAVPLPSTNSVGPSVNPPPQTIPPPASVDPPEDWDSLEERDSRFPPCLLELFRSHMSPVVTVPHSIRLKALSLFPRGNKCSQTVRLKQRYEKSQKQMDLLPGTDPGTLTRWKFTFVSSLTQPDG
ncbi:hypothetical protein DNTS_021776, partial [Danionella cerebrum]